MATDNTMVEFWAACDVIAAQINTGDFPETWAEYLIKQCGYDTAEVMVQAAVAEINDPTSFATLFLEMFDTIEMPLNSFWKSVAVGMSENATGETLQGLYRFAVLCTKLQA